jgi:hypothetical protein
MKEQGNKVIMETYKRFPIEFVTVKAKSIWIL